MRRVAVAAVAAAALIAAPSAQAAIPDVFGGALSCSVAGDGMRECGTGTSTTSNRSTVATWDGVPIDVNVLFPPEPGSGPDGDFPLIIWGHGYGGSKLNFSQLRRFASRGYAVFSMTTRGFRESCGSSESRTAGGAACDDGYVHLMDTRYEVRDAQNFAGMLADEERIDPQRVGAIGGSYGGGLSMALGALRDRVMLPGGSYAPWTSPLDGDPMRIAATAPNVPWTDLVYSLVPNGGTLDYVADSPYDGRFGVMKSSLTEGLYISGQLAPGFYAPLGSDPDADLHGWIARLRQGEPYDGDPLVADVVDELTTHHSSYYISDSTAPAPMLISSGFTDDLFPADEALRFYNRTRGAHAGTPISLFFGNFGHPRAQNRGADTALLRDRENAWLDHYVKGEGPVPFQGVEAQTQVCPATDPSGGPVSAPDWAQIAPGEVRYSSAEARTIEADAGSTTIGTTFDPVNSGGNPCRTADGADQAGTASYRLPAVTSPYTLMGAATVIAEINSPVANSQIAARLLDVAPDGTESLVNRALFRPAVGSARQVFQLHPNGWEFKAGHIPKLELLPKDQGSSVLANYGRPSNGQGQVTVADLELRLPVLQKPGTNGGYVKAPAPKFVPAGRQLAADFAALGTANAKLAKGKLTVGGRKSGARVLAPQGWRFANAKVQVLAPGLTAAKAKPIASGKAKIAGGKRGVVKLRLTKKAKRALRGERKLKVKVVLTTKEQVGKVKAKRVLLLPKHKK